MFGDIGPRMKGGLTRLQQVVGDGLAYVIRGPNSASLRIEGAADRDVTIAGGNGLTPGGVTIVAGGVTGSGAGTGATATLAGGSATPNGTGGTAIVKGADSIGAPGHAILQGGSLLQGTNLPGGNASVIGGTSIINTGGTASLTGGTGAYGGSALVTGGTPTGANADGGDVLIRPGPKTGSGATGDILLDGGRGGAMATTAVAGYIMVTSCAGAPTGVPQTIPTGMIPMQVDTTNLRVYYYISGTWRYATLT